MHQPKADEYERFRIYAVPNNVTVSVTFLNRSLYDAVQRERQAQNLGHASPAVEPLDLVGLRPLVSGPHQKERRWPAL